MATGDTNDMTSLVARSRDGDRAAADALIHAIQPTIYKLAQRFLMDPADAEDATQDILLKIITRLGQFDGRSQFRTWAYAVASNHLRDLKRRPTEQSMSFDEFAEDLAEGLSESPFKGPDATLMLEEVRIGCTLAMLQCLEREARLAYILGEILELDHQEAAEVLGSSTSAYRKRLSRARATVSAFVLGHCGLVNPNNPCRCSKRVLRAKELGRVDPERLTFSTSPNRAQQFPAVLTEIRQLKDNQRVAALFRAQQQPEVSQNFTRWLKTTLEQQEINRSSLNFLN
jgi:RNA polymerase sigma factor (sigma-70 family)